MTGSRDDGWGSVFSDLEPEAARTPTADAPTTRGGDEDEPTDPSIAPPAQRATARGPAPDELPTETSVAPPAPAAFREETLLRTLETSPAPSEPSGAPGPASFWREYRELILTAVLGTAALVAAIAWGRWRPETPARPESTPAERPAAPDPAAGPAEQPPPQREPAGASPSPGVGSSGRGSPGETKPAALPMLSVVTRPPGALVRIDGVVYGRTPLIMQAPTDRDRFDVELRLDEHHPWTGVVTKDEAGHFSVNTELEPRGP